MSQAYNFAASDDLRKGFDNPFVSSVDVLNEGLRPYSYWQVRARKVLDAWEEGARAAGVSTGFESLDRYIRLVPSELVILAARPGMGKTSLALQLASGMVEDPNGKERVAIFSAEMSGWSLYMRMACAAAGVSMFSLRSRSASKEEFERVRRCIATLSAMPILVDDSSSPSMEYMVDELRAMAKLYDLRGMIFDFVELMDEKGNGEQAISGAIKNLKKVAKIFDIPVVAISHLNREVEARPSKIPELSDFRYSGMVEQLADVALLMTRPRYYTERGVRIDMTPYREMTTDDGAGTSNIEDIAYVFTAKNRNGRVGVSRLGYDAPNMRFYDIVRKSLDSEKAL